MASWLDKIAAEHGGVVIEEEDEEETIIDATSEVTSINTINTLENNSDHQMSHKESQINSQNDINNSNSAKITELNNEKSNSNTFCNTGTAPNLNSNNINNDNDSNISNINNNININANSAFNDNISSNDSSNQASNLKNDQENHNNSNNSNNDDISQKRIFNGKATKQMVNYKKFYSELIKKQENTYVNALIETRQKIFQAQEKTSAPLQNSGGLGKASIEAKVKYEKFAAKIFSIKPSFVAKSPHT